MTTITDAAYTKVFVEKIIHCINDVHTIVLRPEHPLDYRAGQFLTFVFHDIHGEERRSYSLSSSPEMQEPMSITLKRVPNGKYSRPLIEKLKTGDVLLCSGISGQFVLRDDITSYKQVFFFAAGIGITPIYSLIKTLLKTQPEMELILFYSNASVAQTVFYKELLNLQSHYPNHLKLEFLFSSSPNLNRARLSKWLLPQLLKSYSSCQPSEQLFYTCGPFEYMRMVVLSLEEAGYGVWQIRKENFDTKRPAFKLEPPDKQKHFVSIVVKDKTVTIPVQYPDNILSAARRQGIILPYSCETGRCGSCMMYCTKGKVWMSYNEVLTERDIAEGKVLTCVGYPVNGDVELR